MKKARTQHDHNNSIEIIQISPSYIFCHGEIGKSDFKPFLQKIPAIDLVYAALPKPENFPFWYKLAKRKKIAHSQFFFGLCEIWKEVNAPEYHIEVGPSNKQQVLDFFLKWKKFPYFYERELYYSAPLNGKTLGMAKCRNPTQILVYSMHPVDVPYVKYSHEYVEFIMNRSERMKVFDPVIGKGLLARFALKNGHDCYGIDMNKERLKCTYEYLCNNLEKTEITTEKENF